MSGLEISRTFCMPNPATFRMPPANRFISGYMDRVRGGMWIDPFCRDSVFKDRCAYTNDLNPEFEADEHVDCVEFLASVQDQSCDGVLFDPPFTVHQSVQCYQGVGGPVKKLQASMCFDHVSRVLKDGGFCLTFGYNSTGPGKKRGFTLKEVLLLSHGGCHNDTIVCAFERDARVGSI